MNRNHLFTVLFSTIKAKITPIVTRLKYWMSLTFWESRILTRIREFLTKVFAVRPRHKQDYYDFFGWLVSRRLAHAIVIAAGLLALSYLVFVNPVFRLAEGMTDGEKIYSYNAVPLRFMKGDVKIKGKSGYVAYEGAVSGGYAAGEGILYSKAGGVVYRGAFEKNKYNGEGTLYYENGHVHYAGTFVDNLFEGTGKLFRESGTLAYEGAFEAGLKEGTGTLFDAAQTAVFTGSFHADELVYSQLLGKSAAEISEIYTGEKLIYLGDSQAVEVMPEIEAFFVADTAEERISDSIVADSVYVCRNTFKYGDQTCTDMKEVREVLGEPVFEGNSYVVFPEAVGIDWMEKNGYDLSIDVSLVSEHPMRESYEVSSFVGSALVYLYVFQKEEMSYTFICEDKGSGFFMYELQVGQHS